MISSSERTSRKPYAALMLARICSEHPHHTKILPSIDYGLPLTVTVNWLGSLAPFRKSPKSAASKAPVPLGPVLAGFIREWQQQTPYGQPTDWVFASTPLKGKQPRVANMLVEDYLSPAAVKVGVLVEGEKVRSGSTTCVTVWLVSLSAREMLAAMMKPPSEAVN
jgi:hypothetical protein